MPSLTDEEIDALEANDLTITLELPRSGGR